MSFNLDKTFSLPATALQVRSQRTKLIAENLAQADTPDYKARDLDFKSALQQAQGRQSLLRTTQSNHIQPAGSNPLDSAVRFRVPFGPALDGNTVETQAEQAKFAENSVNYQATLTLLGNRIQNLMGAIRGE